MTSPTSNLLESSFQQLSEDAKDLFLPSSVKELHTPPSPLVFLREFVMPNIPVVIRGGVQHWPALEKWTDEYISECLGEKMVTVAMTPNGYADAPVDDKFVLPHEEKMKMKEFLKILNDGSSNDIVYIQKQNSSFTDEFDCLIPDAAKEISWASEAFGDSPDAINFWMGGSRSITSTHKDPYENLYAVVRGSKTFTLFPPVDLPHMSYELYSLAKFVRKDAGDYDIVDVRNVECCDDCNTNKTGTKYNGSDVKQSSDQTNCPCGCHKASKVPWLDINPLKPTSKCFENTNPLTVTLQPGDLFYLPSLWFHHVMQKDGTIAVNFWYDMSYDVKYVYYKFVERLSQPNLRSLAC